MEIRKPLIVFLDETGDVSLQKIDMDFPIFAIAGVIFESKIAYKKTIETFNSLKLKYFEHEGIIIHSREISAREGDFKFLHSSQIREMFLRDISDFIKSTEMQIVSSAINKIKLREKYQQPWNPYDMAFHFIFEKVFKYACSNGFDYIRFVAESRGKREDAELHKSFEFLRKKDEPNVARGFPRYIDQEMLDRIHVRLEFRKKTSNIVRHQIADLIVSPIARTVLKNLEHSSFIALKDKFLFGYPAGLKVFPN